MKLQDLGFIENTDKFFGEIRSLTSLRFWAAFYICIFHIYGISNISNELSNLPAFFPNMLFLNGYLAVDFFFILSGFILTYTYSKKMKEKEFSTKTFLIKRLARIYPVHLVTLLIMAFFFMSAEKAGRVEYSDEIIADFWFNLFLVHGWGFGSGISYNRPSWSISAEFFAYLLFPVFCMILLKVKEQTQLIAAILFFVVMNIIYAIGGWTQSIFTIPSLGYLRIMPEFVLGMCVYFFFDKYKLTKNLNQCLLAMTAALLFLLCLEGMQVSIIIAFACIIYLCAEKSRQNSPIFLEKPLWVYLGEISYSLYMVHFCVWIGFVHIYLHVSGVGEENISTVGIYQFSFLTLILSFPIAMLMYHLVEVPSRKWIVRRIAYRQG